MCDLRRGCAPSGDPSGRGCRCGCHGRARWHPESVQIARPALVCNRPSFSKCADTERMEPKHGKSDVDESFAMRRSASHRRGQARIRNSCEAQGSQRRFVQHEAGAHRFMIRRSRKGVGRTRQTRVDAGRIARNDCPDSRTEDRTPRSPAVSDRGAGASAIRSVRDRRRRSSRPALHRNAPSGCPTACTARRGRPSASRSRP